MVQPQPGGSLALSILSIESLALGPLDSSPQPVGPGLLRCEEWVPPSSALSLLLSAGFRERGQMVPEPSKPTSVERGADGVQPGLGGAGVCGAPRAGRRGPSQPHSLLGGAELAVSGFVFQFSKQRRRLCAMKTGQTWDSHGAGGGVRTPVGNIPSSGKPSPWGSLWPRSLTRGQLQASCARAPSMRRQAMCL